MSIHTAVILGSLAAAVSGASAQNPFPPYHVERTKILLTGEDAPGIPGCTVASFLAPQIDGAGKVLIDGNISGPGVTAANNSAVWYGDENGLMLVIREGDPAPSIPGAFIAEPMVPDLCESGTIAMSCYLTGPAIDPAVNARATFAGPPTGLQKIVQAGDPAPFTEPGTVFASSFFFGVSISDNGSLLLHYDLAGPAIDSTNDRAMYVGYPDNPQLIWRRGMQAPGCEEGVVFGSADGVSFNDAGQIAFRSTLAGTDVASANNTGYWAGGAGELELVAREGSQAPDQPPGVILNGCNFPGMNRFGEIGFFSPLAGAGISSANNHAVWTGERSDPLVLLQKGDFAPGAPPGVTLAAVSVSGIVPVNELGQSVVFAFLAGPSVTDASDYASYLGDSAGMQLVLREGDALPNLGDDLFAGPAGSKYAMNDVGDFATAMALTGVGVTTENDKSVWVRRGSGWWVPLLRSGDVLDGFTVAGGSLVSFSPVTDTTGGGDAIAQRFNDAAQLAMRVPYLGGAFGVYILNGSHAGDADFDGDIDDVDYAEFQMCLAGPDGDLPIGACGVVDFDVSDHVDLGDFRVLQEAFSGAELP